MLARIIVIQGILSQIKERISEEDQGIDKGSAKKISVCLTCIEMDINQIQGLVEGTCKTPLKKSERRQA